MSEFLVLSGEVADQIRFGLAVRRPVRMQHLVEPDRRLAENVRMFPRLPWQVRLCLSAPVSRSCPCCRRPARSTRPRQERDRPSQKLPRLLAHTPLTVDIASHPPTPRRQDSAPSRSCEPPESADAGGQDEAKGP